MQVDRPKALFSTWYEFFRVRLALTVRMARLRIVGTLPEIARMGFDVIYLPPVHLSVTKRKGKNNAKSLLDEDTGSPWAVGNESGGHFASSAIGNDE